MANSDLPWQQCFSFTPASSGDRRTSPQVRVQAVNLHPASIRSVTMKVVAGLALLLVNVRLSYSCYGEGQILFCLNIPTAFGPGYSSLVMILKDVGEINSTVLRSDSLASVTRLRIDSAGVTGIAEGAFTSFQDLTNLSLNQNLLREINPKWFSWPGTLSELSLTENQIEALKEFTFSGLANLTSLSLNKNRIRTIDPNTFSSQALLAELDLSENRLTQVSPQVFRSLRSTRIRLHGNPWDCSCGAEDFIDSVKDLQSRSLLDRQTEVTCESPPSVRGRPVWNVSVCVTSVTPPKPTDLPTAAPASTVATTTPPSRLTSETETSVQPKPTEAPLVNSSHMATPPARPTSEAKTSGQPKPTDILTTVTTPTSETETYVTSPPSVTEISFHPKPSDLSITISAPTGLTETCVTSQPSSDKNLVCTLVVVIMVLSFLLFVVCLLVVLHRRKRSNKTVKPGCPKENREEVKGDSSRLSQAQSSGHSEDSELGWRRSFTGVRAKSANAILFQSPVCAPVEDPVTLQTETEAQSKDQAEGKQKLGNESEEEGGFGTENLTDVNVEQAASGRNLDKEPHCVSANTDTVPYLSIGTNQNNPDDFNKQSTDGPGQRSQAGKVMGRISSWPLTAHQWQARCKMMKEEEDEGSDVLTVWKPKFASEVKKVKQPSGSDRDKQDEDRETNPIDDPLKVNVAHMKLGHSQSSEANERTTSFSEARAHSEEPIQDPATARQTIGETHNLNQEKPGGNQDLKPAEKNSSKSSSKSEQRNEPQRAATIRQRAEDRSAVSKAPSSGASPDDETLLSGNEYAFMDLLHEVSQNNGRWTRDRWRQIHINKQRR